MAYTAPRDERKELFARSGLELVGATVAPFVVQNRVQRGTHFE